MNRTVYHRSTIGLRSPGCATQYHLPRRGRKGATVALCNRGIRLDDSNACPETDAGDLMCKRCADLSPRMLVTSLQARQAGGATLHAKAKQS